MSYMSLCKGEILIELLANTSRVFVVGHFYYFFISKNNLFCLKVMNMIYVLLYLTALLYCFEGLAYFLGYAYRICNHVTCPALVLDLRHDKQFASKNISNLPSNNCYLSSRFACCCHIHCCLTYHILILFTFDLL